MRRSTRRQAAPAARDLDVSVDAVLRWQADPVAFVREVIGAEPDPWQVDALAKFTEGKRHALVACKGPGKTTALSWMGLHFLATRPHCKVPCTSITGDNLRDGLWTEFAKWMKKSALLSRGFEWTKTRIFQRENPETWWASARSYAQDADPTRQADTIAGIHEDYILWLLDEVSEMPDGAVVAAEAALTGGIESRMVIAGNCTRTSGPLYRAAVTERRDWMVTKITGDPDDPKRSPRIDIEECRKIIARYGRDSYYVKVNILGEFPDRQADKLLDRADVDAAMERGVSQAVVDPEPRVIGVDVALQGDDATTFAPRQGLAAMGVRELRLSRPEDIGDQLIRALLSWVAHAAFIDCTGGWGSGVVSRCRTLGHGALVHEVNFGAAATDSEHYENKRAEMHCLMSDWVKRGGCLPRDPLLAEELCAPIYWHDKRGRVCLEPKRDIKARLGRSPDRADGLALTFAAQVVVPSVYDGISDQDDRAPSSQRREIYDPFRSL